MKILLFIICLIPYTLMARPEKKYFKYGQVGQHVGSVSWGVNPTSCSWVWTNTGGDPVKSGGDDDCDNNPRTCYGEFNSTDCTCSDGIAGGCDGVYPRIRFSKLKRGVYAVFFEIGGYLSSTNSEGAWQWTDDTTYQGAVFCYDSAGDNQGCTIPKGVFYYEQDQGETVFELAFVELNTTTGNLVGVGSTIDDVEIIIHVFYYPIDTDTKEINFK